MKYPWHCIPRIVQILDWLHDDHEIGLKADDPKQPHPLNTLQFSHYLEAGTYPNPRVIVMQQNPGKAASATSKETHPQLGHNN